MKKPLLVLPLLAAACASPEMIEERGSTESNLSGGGVGNVRITHYTLANEADFGSESDFLCSGRGVAMQGTGIRRDGSYVKYVSGGGGWCGGYARLCNCGSASFAPADGVIGASGRTLTKGYSIAVDPNVIPLGSYVWLGAIGHWFRADDTGGAIIGNHVDVYTAEETPALPESSSTFVTREARSASDPGPNGEPASGFGSGSGGGGSGGGGSGGGAGAGMVGPRPGGGPFEPLNVRAALQEGAYITQCSDGVELVWQATRSGDDPRARWAEPRYAQTQTGDCGRSVNGVHPLVLRSVGNDALAGAWIKQCHGARVARVFRIVTGQSVEGHPTAPYLYSEEDVSCTQ